MCLLIHLFIYFVVSQIVLNSQEASNKGTSYKFLFPYIGDGLISGSGAESILKFYIKK